MPLGTAFAYWGARECRTPLCGCQIGRRGVPGGLKGGLFTSRPVQWRPSGRCRLSRPAARAWGTVFPGLRARAREPSSLRFVEMKATLNMPSVRCPLNPPALRPRDEELLLGYRESGDRDLFAELVHRYERELFSYLRRYLGDAEMAEDAFQAAFLQVHLKCAAVRSRAGLPPLAVHDRHQPGDRRPASQPAAPDGQPRPGGPQRR